MTAVVTWLRVLVAASVVCCGSPRRGRCEDAAERRRRPPPPRPRRPTTTVAADDHAPTTTTTTAPPMACAARAAPRAAVTPPGWCWRCCATNADGTFLARAPCGREVTVRGTPAHRGQRGARPRPRGRRAWRGRPERHNEKAMNLAIAEATKRRLEALGATVVLTRTADYRITLAQPRRHRHQPAAAAVRLHPPQRRARRPRRARCRDLLPDRVTGVEAGRGAALRGDRRGLRRLRRPVGGRPRCGREVPATQRRSRLLRDPQPHGGRAGRAVRGGIHLEPGRGGAPRRPRFQAVEAAAIAGRHRQVRLHRRPRHWLRRAISEDAARRPGRRRHGCEDRRWADDRLPVVLRGVGWPAGPGAPTRIGVGWGGRPPRRGYRGRGRPTDGNDGISSGSWMADAMRWPTKTMAMPPAMKSIPPVVALSSAMSPRKMGVRAPWSPPPIQLVARRQSWRHCTRAQADDDEEQAAARGLEVVGAGPGPRWPGTGSPRT